MSNYWNTIEDVGAIAVDLSVVLMVANNDMMYSCFVKVYLRVSLSGNTFFPTKYHYGDVIMGAIASQISSLAIVYSAFYSGADQRKRGPVNSPHKWPVTRKMFPFDDVIMYKQQIMPHMQLYSLKSRAIFHFRLHGAGSRFAPCLYETALLLTTSPIGWVEAQNQSCISFDVQHSDSIRMLQKTVDGTSSIVKTTSMERGKTTILG